MEDLVDREEHMKQKPEQKNCIISILLSSMLIMLFSPTDARHITVQKFGRFLGLGVANNFDVSKVIRNFYGWFFLFTVLFAGILFTLEYLLRRDPQIRERASWKSLERSMLAAFMVVVFRALAFFWRFSSFSFGYYFILSIFVLDVIYCYAGLEKRFDIEKYSLLKWVSMALGFTAAVVYPGQWSDGQGWLIYFYIIFIALFMVCLLLEAHCKGWKLPLEKAAGNAAVLLLGLPFFTSVYIELVHVLNQYNIFIHKPRRVYCVYLLLFGVVIILGSVLWRNRKIRWKGFGFPLLLLGLSCLENQIPLQAEYPVNFFESANAGVLISDFLHFGKIPLIEHYGGHMLNDVIEAIVYAVVNRDSTGAVLSPYAGFNYVAMLLLFFYFLKELLQSEDSAFLYILCLPVKSIVLSYIWGLLVCICVGNYIKKRGYGSALFVWISCAVAVLSRLDVGTAFGIGAFFCLAVFLLKSRQVQYLKELSVTFLAVIGCGVSTWIVLCLIRRCSPIGRLREFLAVSLSNLNWGTGLLGDRYSFCFALAYMGIPLICVLLMLFFLFLRDPKQTYSPSYYMIMLLGAAYFANVPRGLVRHTLNEMAVKTVVFSGGLFIVTAVYYLYKKERVFVSGAVVLLLILSVITNDYTYKAESLLDSLPQKVMKCIGSWSSEWQEITERKQRVLMPETTVETIDSYDKLFSLLLDEDDTWLDFINNSFLYAALGRECPSYVAQSPGHLSGEYTQEAFIGQIEEEKERIPLAILPAEGMCSIDSISNISRYYKVSEYIFQTYRPLCRLQNAAVWCRKETYEELVSRLPQAYELIDYGYETGDDLYLHAYPMYDIPYLWGNFDTKNGSEQAVVAEASARGDGRFYIEAPLEIDRSKGNYLLLTFDCENEFVEESNNVQLVLGSSETGEDNLYRFDFNLHSGEQQYLIRISADYWWYAAKIDMLHLQTNEKISNVRMQLLQGD